MQLDLHDAPPQYQNLGYALARRVEQRDLSEEDLARLFDILGVDRNGNRQ